MPWWTPCLCYAHRTSINVTLCLSAPQTLVKSQSVKSQLRQTNNYCGDPRGRPASRSHHVLSAEGAFVTRDVENN